MKDLGDYTAVNIAWLFVVIAQVLVIGVLVRRKLTREFRMFLAFLVWNVLRAMLLRWIGGDLPSVSYRKVWVTTEPVNMLLQAVVVLEFHRMLYRAFPGIHRFARVVLLAGAAVALTLTLGTLAVNLGRIHWRAPELQSLLLTKQVFSSLLGFLLLTTMAFFPKAPSARNVLLHGWLLTGFFVAVAGGLFGINFGLSSRWMDVLFLAIQFACLACWAAQLRPRYEKRPRLVLLKSEGGIFAPH